MFDRMADNDQTLPEKIANALNTVEEFTGVNVQKATAQKAGAAYIAQQAAAITLATLAVGGPATLSQEQTRRPDENLPVQNQGSAEPMRSVRVVANTSGESLSLTGLEIRVEHGALYYVVPGGSGRQDRSKAAADGEDSDNPPKP